MENLLLAAIILSFIIVMSGCALLYMYLRAMRFSGSSSGGGVGDLSNMMILFQSMRETLDQQKELARSFNLSIDKKVGDIRKTIDSAGDLTERVAGAEKELNALITEAKEEMASVKRRLEYLQEQIPGFEAAPAGDGPILTKAGQIEDTLDELSESIAVLNDDPVEEQVKDTLSNEMNQLEEHAEVEIIEHQIPSVMDAQGNVVPYDGSKSLPPLNAIASTPTVRRDFIDNWTGMDFGAHAPKPELAKIPTIDEPEDPESSREAFRALLSMQSTPNPDAFINELISDTNGGQAITPMQRRVYEFSDSGMKVSEISRELGMGKGEVKLILNMRRKQA
jgi:gas vesicle protein